LPKDYYSTYLTKLEAVTKEDVLRVAQRYLNANKLFITVVGNKEEVGDKLAVFAKSGEVDYYDMYGNPFSDLTPAPEGMTAADVFNTYYKAIGGVEALSKVNSSVETGTMTMGPMALAYERKQKQPDKMTMNVSMGGQSLMTQVLNGKKGSSSQMGAAAPMTEEEVVDALMQIDPLALLNLDKYGSRAELKGIGQFNGEEAYIIDLYKGDNLSSSNYYSVASGLQIGSEVTQETPQGSMTVSTVISDYIETQGVKFPSHIVQTVGPQTIEIKIDEIAVNRRLNDAEFKVN
jgi:hypothetical protein